MLENRTKALMIFSASSLLVIGLLFLRPWYFSSSGSLTNFIGAELLLVAVANYRKAYFATVLVSFLCAGTALPFRLELLQARWIVLGVGAVIGIAVYTKQKTHSFGTFHLILSFCVLSALVSAAVSAYPGESYLKALSLLMLLLYVAAGARVSTCFEAERLFSTLVVMAEALLWLTAFYYFVLGIQLYGNPNSLGAAISIMVVPLLLWGVLSSQSLKRRLRLNIELCLAVLLLLTSFSRASIGAASFSCIFLCLCARRYRLLIKGSALALVLAAGVMFLAPRPSDSPAQSGAESMSSVYLYKGRKDVGVLGSRRSVWQQTFRAIRTSPWFGTGYGTSAISGDMTQLDYAPRHVDSWVVREHGNSYLAILEWTGLLGVLPFFAFVGVTAVYVGRAFIVTRRNAGFLFPALPAAAIVGAGLIHAMFEDWMFAPGYYMTVFFWAVASVLVDLCPPMRAVHEPRTCVVPIEQLEFMPLAQ